MNFSKHVSDTRQWIQQDFASFPIRFVLEVLAWVASIACSVIMMLTIPNPPFLLVYPIFIVQCAVFCWAAWTRRSFGMMSNYLLLVTIDIIALIRLLLH